VKVRIGIGTGTSVMSGDELGHLVDDVQSAGFDSLWWSDVLTVAGDDPLAAMAYAAGHATRLKIGTTMVLPGRNPVRLAKQLATLDQLSGGRLLVTFVLGLRLPAELNAMGVGAGDRGRQVDEVLPLLRRLWTEEGVEHEGETWKLHGVTVEPKPQQQPFDVWLGGSAPGALRRAGMLADGWLPALCTPAEAAAGRQVIEQAAADAGRRIDPEHFGVSIGYTRGDAPAELLRRIAARRTGTGKSRSVGTAGAATASASATTEARDLVPDGVDGLRRVIGQFVDVGFSKFVVRPVIPPTSFREELKELADGLLDLQT
jgi:probable F420-dependent oxidoreductase